MSRTKNYDDNNTMIHFVLKNHVSYQCEDSQLVADVDTDDRTLLDTTWDSI